MKGKLQNARTFYLIAHITYVQCSFSTARRYHRLITMNSGGLLPGQCVMAKFSTSNIYLYLIVCSDFIFYSFVNFFQLLKRRKIIRKKYFYDFFHPSFDYKRRLTTYLKDFDDLYFS